MIGLYAQSLEISNSFGTYKNGDTITLTYTDIPATISAKFSVTNISNSIVSIKAKRTEIDTITGSINYFCDWHNCYPPTTSVSEVAYDLGAGKIFKPFLVDYKPEGNAGVSTVMYTLFDVNNPSDSTAIIIRYLAGSGVGIEDATSNIEVSNIFPNPAKNSVSLNYNLNGATNARLVIRNILGSVVKSQEVSGNSGRINLNVSDLTNGVYFYSFLVNEVAVKSTKLIIQH